jgi:hypothetical protein
MATMNQLREEFQAHLDKRGIKNSENIDKLIDDSSPALEEKSK